MTRKEQYTEDITDAASMIEQYASIQRRFGSSKSAGKIFALAARLRNYGCLNPFREPDKKVERKRK